jgi:hypothetical protein
VGRLARRILTGLVVCLAATVALFAPPLAAGEEEARERGEWRIRVSRDQWGSATRAEVHDVLVATARELQVFFPARSAEAILVERSPGVPMVLYKRNGDGEYVIHLTVSGRRWAEYAYEFAHELCHIYANYQQRPHSAAAPHQWFEEALCETVSLFVLRRMGRRWQERGVAYGAYAPLFFEYAELLLNEPHRHGALALAPWYAAHARRLSRDPYGRQDNEYCAKRLLPLFEAQPDGWQALPYLNAPTTASHLSFSGYLRHWHAAVPLAQRRFLGELLRLFGLLASDGHDACFSCSARLSGGGRFS